MENLKEASLAVMTLFYLLGGINHLLNPGQYLAMMPPWLPAPEVLNYLSGLVEIAVAILFWLPAYRRIAAYVTIAMLTAFLSVHIYHIQIGGLPGINGVPAWGLWLRLIFQSAFMVWAWWHRE